MSEEELKKKIAELEQEIATCPCTRFHSSYKKKEAEKRASRKRRLAKLKEKYKKRQPSR